LPILPTEALGERQDLRGGLPSAVTGDQHRPVLTRRQRLRPCR
jgi:hypothetical protein